MTVSDTEAEDLIIYAKTRENGEYSARCPGCRGEDEFDFRRYR